MNCYIICVLLATFLRESDSLVYEEEVVPVLRGESVLLECVFPPPFLDCSWTTFEAIPIKDDGNYRIFHNSQTGNCSLQILKADLKRDNMKFRCYKSREETKVYQVIVQTRPFEPYITYNGRKYTNEQKVTYIEGSPDIVCVSENGLPLPVVQWKINGISETANNESVVNNIDGTKTIRSILSAKDILSSENKREVDSTRYFINSNWERIVTCEIIYKSKVKQLKTISVIFGNVYQSTKISLVFFNESHSAALLCKVDGNPVPHFIFEKVETGDKWKPITVYSSQQHLTITKNGRYRCLAKHELSYYAISSNPIDVTTLNGSLGIGAAGSTRNFFCNSKCLLVLIILFVFHVYA